MEQLTSSESNDQNEGRYPNCKVGEAIEGESFQNKKLKSRTEHLNIKAPAVMIVVVVVVAAAPSEASDREGKPSMMMQSQ